MPRTLIFIVSLLLLASCGSGSDTFRFEGRLMKIRMADFFIYSPDGGMIGRDTIKVRDGRFEFETMLDDKATFLIVFPNHSEQPVFAEPGAEVTISGNASQLKKMEIEGTDDNDLYTEFRQETAEMDEEELKKAAEQFIADNPESMVCRYLIDKYFLKTPTPDYKKASELIDVVLSADSTNARMMYLKRQLDGISTAIPGDRLPAFTAYTIKGDTITNDSLRSKVNVINVFATWNSASQAIQSTLKRQKRDFGDSLSVMSICIDADSAKCSKTNGNETNDIAYVCDGKMWDSPLLKTLGISTIPASIVTDKEGKIVATNLTLKEFTDKISSLIKD